MSEFEEWLGKHALTNLRKGVGWHWVSAFSALADKFAASRSAWVPVSVRLPDDDRSVEVTAQFYENDDLDGEPLEVDTTYARYTGKGWTNDARVYGPDDTGPVPLDADVLAWRERVEPWEGDDNG